MADVVANIALGSIAEKIRDGANIEILLLKVAEADATIRDYDNLSLLLAGSNTEADFTNYARKQVTNASITLTVDDTGNVVDADIADQVWTSAGGATNNNLVKLVICEDGGGADTTLIPLSIHDFVITTDGTDLTAQIHTDGFWGSS